LRNYEKAPFTRTNSEVTGKGNHEMASREEEQPGCRPVNPGNGESMTDGVCHCEKAAPTKQSGSAGLLRFARMT